MWTKILSFVLDKDNRQFILLGLLAVAVVFGVSQCDAKQEAKAEVQKQKNNIEALNDVTSYYMNLAGEETAQKLAFQTDKEQLKTLNEDLYEELQKERREVDYLATVNAELRSDTTDADTTETERVNVGAWRFNWEADDSGSGWSRELEGFITFKIDSLGIPKDPRSAVTTDRITMQLVTGITNEDGQKRIFIRSSYPNMTFTNIQGAIIDDTPLVEKPKRFGLGPSLGYGFDGSKFTPYIGFSINYNLIRF